MLETEKTLVLKYGTKLSQRRISRLFVRAYLLSADSLFSTESLVGVSMDEALGVGLGLGGEGFNIWGSWRRSVMVAWRKDPSRVKVEFLLSKFMLTAQSLSRFCLRSRQTANAHPTAWLSRSPCPSKYET